MRLPMRSICAVLLLASGLAFADGEKVKEKAKETVDATKEYANEKKDEFVARIDARLKALKEDVSKVKGKTKDTKDATVADLEAKQWQADAKLAEVKKAGAKAWSSLKEGVEGAVKDLDDGVQSA